MRKRMLVTILTLCFVFSLTGCGETKTYPAFSKIKAQKLESGVVDENERFELSWDQTNKRVILTDKESGAKWSSTPEKELDNNPIESGVKTHPQVDSPVYVTYFDNFKYVEKTAYAYTSAIKNGEVSVEKQEDRISVTYVFESEEISVTVDYILRDDSLLVSVDTSKITEGGDSIVTEVAVAPFFCSAQNDAADSYLFVPSGSGALIYSDVGMAQPVTTSERVYGTDYDIDTEGEFVTYESVKLPVYGAVNGDKGVCAIIEDGAEAASIRTISNQQKMGYAAVYASFLTRGYDLVSTPNGFSSTAAKNKLYSDPITEQTYSIAFYPFSGEGVSYVDMADIYRDYLKETYGLTEDGAKASENAVNLNIVGGTECRNLFLGVPYEDFYATTTLSEAKTLIEKIRSIAGEVNVSLDGFTASGVDIGKPAGGIRINKELGSYKELAGMQETFAGTDTSLFLNYDLVRFRKAGSGVSSVFDAAVATNGKQTVLTVKSLETRLADSDYDRYKLVGRDSLNGLSEKVLKCLTKNKISGVGLATLSNMMYSDYADEASYAGLGMAEQVSGLFEAYREQDIVVMGSSANAYAAVKSDYIAKAPTSSSNYDSFDVDVPFYQIVFKGYVPMSGSAVNLSSNKNASLLKALESGTGLSYTLTDSYDTELVNSFERDFYGMNKDLVIGEIEAAVEDGIVEILNGLKGATIEDHVVINEAVRMTVFSNGTKIWVNYGDDDYSDGTVTVAANGYRIER